MSFALRSYRDEDDYWRIRAFLRETLLLNQRRERNWQVYRFDYWRWHVNGNIEQFVLQDVVFLWETGDGRLAAVLHPDGRGEAVLQVHPVLGTAQLESGMIDLAEQRLAAETADGRRSLRVWVNQHDHRRQALVRERGYTRGEWPEYQRRRLLSTPIPDVPVAAGYTIRALGDRDELPARSWLSWRAFHPDEPDDRHEGWDWYLNVQRAPMYRRDLDLVAVAPDGDLAAFCTIWFDDVTRTGAFEPVGTEPLHQRRGLGKALMCDGLRRLRRLGATLAYVGSYGAAAHALYESAGFTEYELSEPWSRTWVWSP